MGAVIHVFKARVVQESRKKVKMTVYVIPRQFPPINKGE